MNSGLLEHFRDVRRFTRQLCDELEPEDFVVQSMPDVSPTKWHLAHTTWFFDTFVLAGSVPDWDPPAAYDVLFNSYYQTVGDQWPRERRGVLSRPTTDEVMAYRAMVDEAVDEHFDALDTDVLEIGIHHEQQHQELLLTDIKHVFAQNPLHPVFAETAAPTSTTTVPAPGWRTYAGGMRQIGHSSEDFCYDNELPRHETFVGAFEIADRLVTAGEWLDFIEDGGYRDVRLWLSAGWAAVRERGWNAPLYWTERDGQWFEMTLGGFRPVDRGAPVTHISFFEAEAYATWAGARLPTEFEWEVASSDSGTEQANFADSLRFHPFAGDHDQFFGDVWEWTRSDYGPYPGYRAPEGAIGEYNGKFMCGQYVLRGGSCATSLSHIRPTYRNFFPPDARWQFSGVRLAK